MIILTKIHMLIIAVLTKIHMQIIAVLTKKVVLTHILASN